MLTSLFALLPLLAISVSAGPIERRATGVQIHPNGDISQCLQVQTYSKGVQDPSQVANDSPLSVGACGAPGTFSAFDISYGDQLSVKLTGSNLCFDAGSNPGNNGIMKLYTCYPGLPQQHYYLTPDNHISITNGDQCVDRRDGGATLQTFRCIGYNTNQIWTLGNSSPPPTTTSAATATATATGSSGKPNPYAGLIHFNGDQSQCLAIQADQPIAAGSDVNVQPCSINLAGRNTWQYVAGQTTFVVGTDSSLCLDFGSDTDGSKVKVQKCNGGASQDLFCKLESSDRHGVLTGMQTLATIGLPGEAERPVWTRRSIRPRARTRHAANHGSAPPETLNR